MDKPIGILGGTFDPIHYGHLRPAQQIVEKLDLAQLNLMLSHQPPLKATPGVSSLQRAAMTELACQDLEKFTVDLRELKRDEPSYTVVTLRNIRQELPNTPLCFLMGMDSLLGLKNWYHWPELLQLCHLIVSYRPGWTLTPQSDVADLLAAHQTQSIERLHHTLAGHIYLMENTLQDISSTQIRQAIRDGSSTEALLPAKVRGYIDGWGLYRGQ